MRIRAVRLRYPAILVALVTIATACSDATGPNGKRPPGRRLLADAEFGVWTWTPAGTEIVFSTKFGAGPTRIEAIGVPGGVRRTIVPAPTNGDQIIGQRFVAVGSHVYYEFSPASRDHISLYRTPLAGGNPEKIIEVSGQDVSVSSDERSVAWVEHDPIARNYLLVTTDIATGNRRTWPLQQHANRVTWSPTGRSAVVYTSNVVSGAVFQWIDLVTGAVRVWQEPIESSDLLTSRDITWDGESPLVYVTGVDVSRYSIATGARVTLSTLQPAGHAVGWSRDFETVFVASSQCLTWSSGVFGSNCLHWANRVDRVAWRAGTRTSVLRFEANSDGIPLASPTGSYLAYDHHPCGSGGCGVTDPGLYIIAVP